MSALPEGEDFESFAREQIRQARAIAALTPRQMPGRPPEVIEWMEKLERAYEDGSIWSLPPVEEQITKELHRLGLPEE